MFTKKTKPGDNTISKETQEMLKLMMKEAKLTNLQQRNITRGVENNGKLPRTIQSTYKPKKQSEKQPLEFNMRSYTPQSTRSLDSIKKTGDLEREVYRGKPIPPSRDSVKEELAEIMEFGEKIKKPTEKDIKVTNKKPSEYRIWFGKIVD